MGCSIKSSQESVLLCFILYITSSLFDLFLCLRVTLLARWQTYDWQSEMKNLAKYGPTRPETNHVRIHRSFNTMHNCITYCIKPLFTFHSHCDYIMKWVLEYFAYATTAQLSWAVQNVVAIIYQASGQTARNWMTTKYSFRRILFRANTRLHSSHVLFPWIGRSIRWLHVAACESAAT